MFFFSLFESPATTFLKAARDGNYEIVHGMLEQDVSLVLFQDPDRHTALHLACSSGQLKVVKLLLKSGANVAAVDVTKRTPLHSACIRSDSSEIARLLLDAVADIEAKTRGGWTALHLACKTRNLEVIQLLLKRKANIEAKNSIGETALHLAASIGCVELALLLIKAKADIQVNTNNGSSPLHYACSNGHLKTAQLLIQHGAQLEAMDRRKQTPLHMAARRGSFEMVQLLLDKGANIEATSYAGDTPLHVACVMGHLEVVILLIDMGADVMSKCANGTTALKLARQSDIRLAILNAQNAAAATSVRIDDGDATNGSFILPDAILSPQDEKLYPLHGAIKYGYEEDIAEAIAEIDGESKNLKDSQGRTAIDLAALTGQWEMMKYLKEQGCVHSFKPKFAMQNICRQRNDRMEKYLKQVRGSGKDDGKKVDGVMV
ncbi:MAG: hypothetical protein SGBAC_010805 [Bacillariaceae sp.]